MYSCVKQIGGFTHPILKHHAHMHTLRYKLQNWLLLFLLWSINDKFKKILAYKRVRRAFALAQRRGRGRTQSD